MSFRLKPVGEQTIVLTGASSGIGLATARALADRGAALVLVSCNEGALDALARECRARGGRALAICADVGRNEDLERIAQLAIDTFGGFDTWINNAGVAIYGTCEQVPLADQRRLFDTNYWGVVYGSLIAAKHLRERGGKIINTGSVLSDRAVILQGPYSASKHAVKAFTDVLRMELEESGAPVSVTLIKPSAIDTPYMEHARNYLGSEGTKNPPPSYDPWLVAKAMVYACENHKRDLVVGFGGWAVSALGQVAPRLTDSIVEATGRVLQESSNPGRSQRRDNLYTAREDGAERSSLPGGRLRTSLFLAAQMHPVATTLTLLAAGATAGAWLVRNRSVPFGDSRRARGVRRPA
jgi:NAD(P)-dependent dehydrogenase (short-subunit alcohol dehydrogenase family)